MEFRRVAILGAPPEGERAPPPPPPFQYEVRAGGGPSPIATHCAPKTDRRARTRRPPTTTTPPKADAGGLYMTRGPGYRTHRLQTSGACATRDMRPSYIHRRISQWTYHSARARLKWGVLANRVSRLVKTREPYFSKKIARCANRVKPPRAAISRKSRNPAPPPRFSDFHLSRAT